MAGEGGSVAGDAGNRSHDDASNQPDLSSSQGEGGGGVRHRTFGGLGDLQRIPGLVLGSAPLAFDETTVGRVDPAFLERLLTPDPPKPDAHGGGGGGSGAGVDVNATASQEELRKRQSSIRVHNELRRQQVSQPLRPVIARWPTQMTDEDKAIFKANSQAMRLLLHFGYAVDDSW